MTYTTICTWTTCELNVESQITKSNLRCVVLEWCWRCMDSDCDLLRCLTPTSFFMRENKRCKLFQGGVDWSFAIKACVCLEMESDPFEGFLLGYEPFFQAWKSFLKLLKAFYDKAFLGFFFISEAKKISDSEMIHVLCKNND